MNTLQVKRPLGETQASPDPSWSDLYRAGGVSAVLFVVLILVAIVLIVVAPPPLSADGATTLQYIAAHKVLYTIEQVLWLAPSVFAAVVFLALYQALKHLNKSYAALGALAGFVSWVLGLAIPTTGGGAPVLVYLSDHYMTATTAVQHTAFATAAEAFIAENNIPFAAGILAPVGILILSLVMLKGVFPKGVAYLGIATGVLGFASEALRPMIGSGYFVYGLLLPIWFLVVGWKLYRMARQECYSGVLKAGSRPMSQSDGPGIRASPDQHKLEPGNKAQQRSWRDDGEEEGFQSNHTVSPLSGF